MEPRRAAETDSVGATPSVAVNISSTESPAPQLLDPYGEEHNSSHLPTTAAKGAPVHAP
jgi:hypothetical protein